MYRKFGILCIIAIVILAILPKLTVEAQTGVNLALNKPATSSSNENAGTTPNLAVDGNAGTRWSSTFSDPQWIQIDLGATVSVNHVKLTWEAAYGKSYQIQMSINGTSWTNIFTTTTGDGGTDDLTGLSGSGRYIRMNGTVRATQYGYSLWEFEVYGPTAATNTPTRTITPTGCGTTNVALNKPATSSSNQNGTLTPNLAVDANLGTRWSSAASDPQWIQIDLGSTLSICHVKLTWEAAYGKSYQIQVSTTGTSWTNIFTTTTGDGGTDDLTGLSGSGRYIRMNGTVRATQYGYSLWEFEVYTGSAPVSTSTPTTVPTNTPTATRTNTPPATFQPPTNTPVLPTATQQTGPVDFGPNVIIYDPSMAAADIQNSVNNIFTIQQSNQFGNERYALLFKPGTYVTDINVGFYTQVSGLGLSPNDTTVKHVYSDAQWFNGNATQNFWRIAENLNISASNDSINTWAVSQAAPFRRMNVHGELKLDPSGDGYSSGGFIADSVVSGQAFSGSQQQYLTRNSQIGSWSNCVWNCVFLGVNGAPAQSYPNPPYTTIGQTPVIAEKPFLTVDAAGNYSVFVPALRSNSSGTTWSAGAAAGSSIPISQFYIVKAGATATSINNALAAGQNLLVTPGVYHLSAPINVTRAGTVVLGMGLATFINDSGAIAMTVADVDGVRIGGILFDAGTTNAPVLLQVGPSGASASHAANPTILYDVFARIGGAVAGKVTTAVIINSSNVIVDDTWLWRADHGSGVGWTVNTSNTGLIVNGANVTTYGLFVEHFQQYNVIWNANGGRDYFFQNELPYDPPDQASYMNGSTQGWAAYKVASTVTNHQAWGVGSYVFFQTNPSVVDDHAFEAPNTAGVVFHDLLTISLGNTGTILHIINSSGAQTNTSTTPSTLTTYP